jgi:predicted kinase
LLHDGQKENIVVQPARLQEFLLQTFFANFKRQNKKANINLRRRRTNSINEATVKRLIILVGIPGAGKSTLAKKIMEKGFHCLSADPIREELYGNAAEQGDKEEVFKVFFERFDDALAKELDIIIDNTNLNPRQRKPILERAQKANYSDVQLWLLDVPLDVCLKRNASRPRVVPDDIVANMFMELNRSGRPQRSEGKLVLIRPGNDENDFRFFFPQ